MKRFTMLAGLSAVLLGAACTAIAGLDGNYTVGETNPGAGGATAGGGASTISSGGGGASTTSAGGTGGTASGSGGTGAAGGGGTGGSGGRGPSCIGTNEFAPVVADCIDTTMPDPDLCLMRYGNDSSNVSQVAFSFNTPHHTYLRFDTGTINANDVASVSLEVTVTGAQFSDGNSGEIWTVVPFARTDLFNGPPANVGNSAISAGQGNVVVNQTVSWSLPTNVVNGGAVHLEIKPLAAGNTVYWNGAGSVPPKLIVTCN